MFLLSILLASTFVKVATEKPSEEYVLAFPREGFVLPLYDWDPQHRKHIANGWVEGRSPWNIFERGLPPRPPKDPELPEFSPSPSPTPFTEHPSPSPTGSEEKELCIPSPDCVEPHTGPISGGVRVTIQGEFLSRSLEDIQEIRLCGVPCVDVELAPFNEKCLEWRYGTPTEENKNIPYWYVFSPRCSNAFDILVLV